MWTTSDNYNNESWYLINTGKIENFINHRIVKTENEERQDKMVEEILRKLEEKNLYMKPEKYK